MGDKNKYRRQISVLFRQNGSPTPLADHLLLEPSEASLPFTQPEIARGCADTESIDLRCGAVAELIGGNSRRICAPLSSSAAEFWAHRATI
jgi:hypothetical protein